MKVIYEDKEILILDKPAGIVVNRSETFSGQTVQDFVEEQVDFEAPEEGEEEVVEFKARSGVVHRLDKDTSGVLVVAKTKEAFENIQKQFKDRLVKKEYRAMVIGAAPKGEFAINAPIDRNPRKRFTMAIVAGGREAETNFETIESFKLEDTNYSYIKAMPLTGRTHQIRIHLAALNLPVAGDPIYDSRSQFEISSKAFSRMMLHALSIQFTHPRTNKIVKYEASLPKEFTKNI